MRKFSKLIVILMSIQLLSMTLATGNNHIVDTGINFDKSSQIAYNLINFPTFVERETSRHIIQDSEIASQPHDSSLLTIVQDGNEVSNKDVGSSNSGIPNLTSSITSVPFIEYSSSLNVSSITVADETDETGIQYEMSLTGNGYVDVDEIPIDYMIALDASGSVGSSGWQLTIDWAQGFVSSLKPTDRIGFVIFSTGATLEYSLTDNQNRTIINNFLSSYVWNGGYTFTDVAVELVIQEFDDSSDFGTPKFFFLVTDGVPLGPEGPGSHDPCLLKPAIDNRDIESFIIGVGNWDPSQVSCLVDNPLTDMVFYEDYDDLEFDPQALSDILQGLINLTASNILLNVTFDSTIDIFSMSHVPSLIVGNSLIWSFDQIKDNETITVTVDVRVTGSGVVPVVTTGELIYQPVIGTPVAELTDAHDVIINVIPPIDQLFDCIEELILGLGLNQGNTNSLLVKLYAAYEDYEVGDIDKAVKHLDTLIKSVNALVNPGKISMEDATIITDKIELLVNTMLSA